MDLGKVFSALAHESRRKVVAELAAGPADTERACGSFDLPVKKATRTHHFRVLREAGLIRQRDHGNGSAVSLPRQEIERRLPGLLALLVEELKAKEAETRKPTPPRRQSPSKDAPMEDASR